MRDVLPRPPIGAPAPAIELPDVDGITWRLADQRERCIVVIFHRHIH